jgi:arsenate reductase
MAEGLLRHLGDGRFEASGAGCAPGERVYPHAVEVMGEVGVDISGQRPEERLERSQGLSLPEPQAGPSA